MLKYLKAITNVLVVLMIFALLALGIVTIAVQFPSVQTFLVQTATARISEKMGYPIEITRVNIKWFDVVSLEGVSVKDTSQKQMIDVGRIDVNLNMQNILENSSREVHLDEVTLYQPNVHLVVVPKTGDLNIDGFINRIVELTSSNKPRPANAPENNTPFTIGRSKIVDGTFRYDDPRKPKDKGSRTFDYSHFELNNMSADLKNFLAQGDTISFLANNMKSVDKQTGMRMHDLDTRFLFCQKKMELKELSARIGKSFIGNDITFHYNRSGDLGDFNHKVFLRAHFVGSYIHSSDLGLFSTYVDGLNETWRVSGDFDGRVDDFELSHADIRFGQGSRLLGDLGFKGLPDLGPDMNLQLSLSKILPVDLVQYYPEWKSHETLQKFGVTLLEGKFKGTIQDFDVNASVSSELGKASGDLVFHITDEKTTTYSGQVKTSDFEIGKLIDQPETWQRLDFDGTIHGKGLDLANASTNMDAVVSRIGFKNYDYRNIALKGNLQNQYFNGLVSTKDSNLVVSLEGEFDLSKPKNSFDLQGIIEKANLQQLGFTKEAITLQTQLDVRVNGNTVDELVGDAQLLNTFLITPKKERNLVIDTLLFSSRQNANRRILNLESEFLTANIEGDFVPTRAWKDINQVLEEYQLYFLENESDRNAYYSRKEKTVVQQRYEIDYELETKNIGQFLAFVNPDIYVSHGSKAEGKFKMDNTAFLSLNATADTARYGKNEFIKSEVDVTTSKFVNSAEVLASVLVTSTKQQISVLVPTEKMELEGTWDVDHIDFNGGIKQVSSTNRANLAGEIRFLPAGLDISFENSRLNLLDEEWNMPANSLISIIGKDVTFNNLGLINGKQRLAVNGTVSSDPDQTLMFDIKNFKLGTLNPVLNTQLAGIMDGSAKMRDAYNNFVLDANFNIESLGYANYEFGNFSGTGEWDQFDNQLQIDAELNKNARKIFSVVGSYRPKLKVNNLNLKAIFNEMDFKALEPFAEELVSDVSGEAHGTVLIKGTLNAPVLDGSIMVEKGRMKFDYLQSVFTFSDKINFTESEITVNNMTLTDPDGNTASLRGGVFHDGFKYFSLGFNADLHNFKILNTAVKDNEMFYGTAYVTGPVNIFGPIDNMSIEANVTSNKGTRIYIPLDGATEVATQDYIQFVSQMPKADSTITDKDLGQSKVAGGIKMNFNFNLTPDATCEIIFDRQTGDIIRANGNGRLNLNIDTKGDFTMVGTYEIDRGDYNFTLQNVINKKFTIKKGSRIVWSGDPYGAQLDVRAGYTQLVSLSGVLPNTSASNVVGNEAIASALSRRYPVEVTISLSDRLMNPTIKYELQIPDNPSLSVVRGQLEAFQNKLKSDEQELSRQVSSLLVVNQLLPEVNTATSQNFVGNSISELVSNQISRWASTLNENLEVGVSGLSLDQNALNNLQLRFSYRFLNDRFRITRDGRISNSNITGANQYDATSILGEWTLEYWLTPNGSIRAKAYNRNIQNALYLNNTLTTGGVSMQFTHSFNRFKAMPKPALQIPYVLPIPVPVDSAEKDTGSTKFISGKELMR